MPDESNRDTALCLSGGGLRATLFHLGLIKALRLPDKDGAMPLSRMREVYSVSGGSIFAAHLIKNWANYTGDDEQFAKAEREMLAFVRRDIRNRVVRRWLLTLPFGGRRTSWLEREYRKLFGSMAIEDCYKQDGCDKAPDLFILATSFTTGEYCSFGRREVAVAQRLRDGTIKFVSTPGGHLPLSFAVTASSAFPPMFPPITLTTEMLRDPAEVYFQTPTFLSDGGVYDNLGMEMFFARRAQTKDAPANLIVSNAGGPFQAQPNNSYVNMITRNIRASDILMRRVEEATVAGIRSISGINYTSVSIRETVDDPGLTIGTQQHLRLVRTDLDSFSAPLSALLIDHGCRMGENALGGVAAIGTGPRLAAKYPPDLLEEVAARAGVRRLRPLFLDFRDWALVPLWTIAIIVVGAIGLTVAAASQRARAEQARVVAEQEKKEAAAKQAEAERLRQTEQKYVTFTNDLRAAVQAGDQDKLAALLRISTKTGGPVNSGPPPVAANTVIPQYTVATPTAAFGQSVYLQFAGTLTRPQVAGLNQSLRAKGWRVQSSSGESVNVALNEVRYSGDNARAAQALADAVTSTGIAGAPIKIKQLSIIGANALELWISK